MLSNFKSQELRWQSEKSGSGYLKELNFGWFLNEARMTANIKGNFFFL